MAEQPVWEVNPQLQKPNMSQEQIAFIQNLFANPQAGLDFVNKTFDSLKDASGSIPRATFGPKIKEITMGLGAPEPKPEDLEAAIQRADPNGDGKITYDEFKDFCVASGDGLLTLLGL